MSYAYSHLFQIPTTGLRYFTVYGPWGRPDMAAFLFTKAILAEKPISVFNHGKMRRNFTYIDDIRKQGDSVGGVVSAYITGCPVGLGEPVFDKLHAELGKAMLSINAVKGFEYGSGFDGVELRGSQHNDIIVKDEAGKVSTVTNHSGGIQGGISNGEPIYFRVGFKPVATIMQDQASLNNSGEKIVVSGKGRHDPCVVPRAVPIVEAMSAIVLLDFYLRNRLTKLADVL